MKTFPFSPELRIFRFGPELVITFDSRCPQDATRGTRSVRVPLVYRTMAVNVEGFATREDADGMRTTYGQIDLIVTDRDGVENTHVLSECTMTFDAPEKKGVPQYDALITPPQVAHIVYQGVSEALSAALNALLHSVEQTDAQAAQIVQQAQAASGQPMVQTVAASVAPAKPKWKRAANDGQSWPTWKKLAVGIPVAAIVSWLLIGAIAPRQAPVEKAVHASVMNPQDIDAQIALTTETLKQMGINPGNPQDVGCLTQN